MYFRTQPDWAVKNPIYAVFDDPETPSFRWRAVELPLAVFYYHLHIKLVNELESFGVDLLMGDFDEALKTLQEYPGSTLFLQTPEWANNGEPGLYRVLTIYKAVEPLKQYNIAECSDGKMFVLSFICDAEEFNPLKVKKEVIWSSAN